MDTPERNQIGTPLSKIEESPFSNFANSLSPIDASKPTHISQTFSSISFTSPPSVFTSPHVSLHKDSRFLRRHQVSDLAKPKLSSEEENRSFKAEQLLSADQQHQESTNDEVRSEKPSNNEASVDPLSDVSKVTTDSASEIDGRCELNMSGALVSYVEEPHVASFGAELNSHDMDQDNVEEPCDWQSLISGSTDLLVLDSPNDTAVLKESFQNSIPERNAFVSLLSRFPPSLENGPSDSNHVNSAMYNESSGIDQSAQSTEINVLEQMDQVPENRALVCMHDYASVEKLGNKSFYNVHRGLRRRCLDFEMPRAKIIDSVLHTSSSLSLFEAKSADSKHPITPRHDSSRCVLPSIGLHLNALAAASNDCRVPNQEMSTPRSEEALLNSTASVPSEKDAGLAENELQIVEDPLLAAMYAATAEVNSNSPKKKRSKTENNTEGESCKRCNCKKSKCLKLYCECFAAGVYCVEPCSCQDCFNKPIHEETVLATRKQIESRNPLAFAPKVIRTLDSTQEIGQEDSTRTPASARHKRGCNCKKSNCLKKYCECYQGGVGCSVSCRCEGCKNAFGRKEGMTLLGMEAEIEEHAPEKHIMDKDPDLPASASYLNDDKQNSELTLPKTPLRLLRTSVSHPTSSKGKPPRSSTAKMSSSSYLNPIDGAGRSTFLRCQTKVDKCRVSSGEELPTVLENTSPPPSSSIKTLSPNGKRVSTPHGNGTSPAMRSSRKLILQSIPSFPSLTPRD